MSSEIKSRRLRLRQLSAFSSHVPRQTYIRGTQLPAVLTSRPLKDNDYSETLHYPQSKLNPQHSSSGQGDALSGINELRNKSNYGWRYQTTESSEDESDQTICEIVSKKRILTQMSSSNVPLGKDHSPDSRSTNGTIFFPWFEYNSENYITQLMKACYQQYGLGIGIQPEVAHRITACRNSNEVVVLLLFSRVKTVNC